MSVHVSVHLRVTQWEDQDGRPEFSVNMLDGKIPTFHMKSPTGVHTTVFIDARDIPALMRALAQLQDLAAERKSDERVDMEQPVEPGVGDNPPSPWLDADRPDGEAGSNEELQEG